MLRGRRNSLRGSVRLILPCALALFVGGWAAPPKIELIELFQTNQVLIHFDTEANLAYELQVAESPATNGPPGESWTNLFIAPSTPFPNHYVIVDTRSHRQRFYRLRVNLDSAQ